MRSTNAVAVSLPAVSPLFGVGAVAAAGAGVAVAGTAAAAVAVAAVAVTGAASPWASAAPASTAAASSTPKSNRPGHPGDTRLAGFTSDPPPLESRPAGAGRNGCTLERSDRLGAGLAGADAYRLLEPEDEDIAVADLPGPGDVGDRLDHLVADRVLDGELDLGLRDEVDAVFGAAVKLRVAALPA